MVNMTTFIYPLSPEKKQSATSQRRSPAEFSGVLSDAPNHCVTAVRGVSVSEEMIDNQHVGR
jgi:hypothetical protein